MPVGEKVDKFQELSRGGENRRQEGELGTIVRRRNCGKSLTGLGGRKPKNKRLYFISKMN